MRALATLGRSAPHVRQRNRGRRDQDRRTTASSAQPCALDCPTVDIVGTGAHSGATEEEMRTLRSASTKAEATNKHVSVFATTP